MILFALHVLLALGPTPPCAPQPLSVTQLDHVRASEVATAVQPLLDDPAGCGARLVALGSTNQLLVRAAPAQRARLLDLLQRLDRPTWQPTRDAPVKLIVERRVGDPGPGPDLGHPPSQIWYLPARAGEEIQLPIKGQPAERITVRIEPTATVENLWAGPLRYARAVRSLAPAFGADLDVAGWSCRVYWSIFRGETVQYGDGRCESLL